MRRRVCIAVAFQFVVGCTGHQSAVHYGKPQKPTDKATRQPVVGKRHFRRVLFVEHIVKTLPCAFSDPRQLFWAHVAQHLCRVLYRPGTRQSPVLCRVPGYLHTAKNVQGHCFEGFFAVCHGKCTQQRAQILFVFFVYYVYGTPSITSILYISQ